MIGADLDVYDLFVSDAACVDRHWPHGLAGGQEGWDARIGRMWDYRWQEIQ
jgi:hypothetical protein